MYFIMSVFRVKATWVKMRNGTPCCERATVPFRPFRGRRINVCYWPIVRVRHDSEKRPFEKICTSADVGSDLSVLGNLQRIIYLNAEVPHRAFQFGVAQQQLNRSQVFGPFIDQRGFGPSHRVGSVD